MSCYYAKNWVVTGSGGKITVLDSFGWPTTELYLRLAMPIIELQVAKNRIIPLGVANNSKNVG